MPRSQILAWFNLGSSWTTDKSPANIVPAVDYDDLLGTI